MPKISVIIPARNEADSLRNLLPEICRLQPGAQIIVVNDGSTDDTSAICKANEVHVVEHPYAKGNGAAIKSGARHAAGDILVFMDGDGQHRPEDIGNLLERIDAGYDMAVGARSHSGHASRGRLAANSLYNWLATRITGHQVADLTSGFRAVRASMFREFLYLLPNGFSYPTTITMAFFRAGYSIAYVPIVAEQRTGKSHIRPVKDGVRFLLIIFKVGTLYSPLKIFFPASFVFFAMGLGYYIYTYAFHHQFTNMGALLFSVSAIIFLIGLISEQITALMYKH